MPKIIILPQIHGPKGIVDLLLKVDTESALNLDLRLKFPTIVESAYKIARFLAKHPYVPVIFENNSPFTIPLTATTEKMLKKKLFSLFSDGNLPEFETLTFEQKRFLVCVNPYKFSLLAGKISQGYYDYPDNLRLSEELEPMASIKNNDGARRREKQEQSREYNVLAYARDIAQTTESNSVIVIYGAAPWQSH